MATELKDDDQTLLNEMLKTLRAKRRRNELRRKYAEAEIRAQQMGIAVPPSMAEFAAVLGWPRKAVEVRTQRLRPQGFTLSGAADTSTVLEDLDAAWTDNEMELGEKQAIEAAVEQSCSFAFVTRGATEKGEADPLITIRSAEEATALIDSRSRRVTAAVEQIGAKPGERLTISTTRYNLYLPGETVVVSQSTGKWMVEDAFATTKDWVLCSPYIHAPRLNRQFGSSAITRPVMSLTDMAVRVLLRQEVSAEFYSSPQRYLLGATQDQFRDEKGELIPMWEFLIGSMVVMPDQPEEDEDGNLIPDPLRRAEVGQFPQMSMQPHSDHIRTVAMMFAGETNIPSDYLGIIHDNPSSADAIRANERALVAAAEAEQVNLGASRVRLAKNVLVALNNGMSPALAKELRGLKSRWKNASTPSLIEESQDVAAQVGAQILLPDSEVAHERLGYDPGDIARIKEEHRAAGAQQRTIALVNALASAQQNPTVAAQQTISGQGTAADLTGA